MSTRSVLASCLALLCLFLFASPARAVVNGTPIPCEDRRFDAIGLFLNGGFWSCGGYVSGSCVLIAPDCVLIARHSLDITTFQPLPNPATQTFRVRFRRATNGDAANSYFVNGSSCSGIYQEYRVSRFVDAAQVGTDMTLAYLERPVEGIRPIGFEINSPPPAGSTIILAGWGYSGTCFQTGEFASLRYAFGRLPAAVVESYFAFSPCSMSSTAPCVTCPAGGPYVLANLHDSGGAVLYEVPNPGTGENDLRLLGTVYSVAQAKRPTLWNSFGGVPRFQQAVPTPAALKADFNRDTLVDVGDVFAYLDAFFAGRCIADVGTNGSVTSADLFTFMTAYFGSN